MRTTDQIIRYFKFPCAGERSITQIMSFIMSLEIRLNEITNTKIVSDNIIQLALKSNSQFIIEKLLYHLELIPDWKLDE